MPNDKLDQQKTTNSSTSTRREQGLFGRVIESKLFWLAFVVLAFAVPLYRSFVQKPLTPPPVLSTLKDFELVDQGGRKVSLASLKGSVLVTNFIFTSCPDTCPRLTAQMAKIQNRVLRSAPLVKLVSISVDPETDTPEVLKEYGNRFKSDPRVWTFLTGSLKDIEDVVVAGFKVAIDRGQAQQEDVTNLMDITHGEHFVIVDQLGQIRAYKFARTEVEINEIVRLVAILANTRPDQLNEPAATQVR
jgi:protein SCO1